MVSKENWDSSKCLGQAQLVLCSPGFVSTKMTNVFESYILQFWYFHFSQGLANLGTVSIFFFNLAHFTSK